VRVANVVPSILLVWTLAACRGERSSLTADAGPPAGSADAPTSPWRVVDEGRAPRAALAFVFAPGRSETRVVEIENQVDHGGAPPTSDRLKLRFEVRYTAVDAFELQVKQVDATGADVPGLAAAVGAVFKLKTVEGALAPVEGKFPEGTPPGAQGYLDNAMGVITPMLLPMVPPFPVGEGARWRAAAGDGPTHTLVSRTTTGVVVEQHGEIRGARRRERMAMVRVNEDLTVRIESPFDGIARGVEATVVQERTKGGKHTTRVHLTDGSP
jgi:hypothetical protein